MKFLSDFEFNAYLVMLNGDKLNGWIIKSKQKNDIIIEVNDKKKSCSFFIVHNIFI